MDSRMIRRSGRDNIVQLHDDIRANSILQGNRVLGGKKPSIVRYRFSGKKDFLQSTYIGEPS